MSPRQRMVLGPGDAHKHTQTRQQLWVITTPAWPQQLRRAFQQQAVLRVHCRRLGRRQAKGGGIKQLNTLHEGPKACGWGARHSRCICCSASQAVWLPALCWHLLDDVCQWPTNQCFLVGTQEAVKAGGDNADCG
jgi:hypothetical protein